MAIEWTESKYDEATGTRVLVNTGTTHEGLVVGPRVSREERVMSDVYADCYYALVWNPLTEKVDEVFVGSNFECNARWGKVTPDADLMILSRIARESAEQEEKAKAERAARLLAEREEKAKECCLKIEKGAEVLVVRGIKVPKGTRGTVFAVSESQYGPRVGFNDLATGEATWTAEKNVVAVLPGKSADFVPEGGWVTFSENVAQAKNAWEATFPKRGDRVRIVASGIAGKVGWVGWAKDARFGVDVPGTKDRVWANAWDLAIIASDGSEYPIARAPQLVSPTPTTAPQVKTANGLLGYPEPFCWIQSLRDRGDGSYDAYDADGVLLVRVPKETADEIHTLLGLEKAVLDGLVA